MPTRLLEARRAVPAGKLPRQAGLILARHDQQYELTLQAETMAVGGAKLQRPLAMRRSRLARVAGCKEESASRISNQSPDAARVTALRVRETWLSGSKTTRAPAARATWGVRSVELLSQTITSADQLGEALARMASARCSR